MPLWSAIEFGDIDKAKELIDSGERKMTILYMSVMFIMLKC